MSELVSVEKITKPQPRLLLDTSNLNFPARVGPTYQVVNPTSLDIPNILKSKYLAVDYETRGTEYWSKNCDPVGVALAWDSGSCYLDLVNLGPELIEDYLHVIEKHPRLIAHNVYFDAGWSYRATGKLDNWYMCTYASLAHLMNEGYVGNSGWGLKSAMRELLGWGESNEAELDTWLVENKYVRGNSKTRPDKAQMWRAPAEILGKYSVLDAEACYLLATQVIIPVLRQYPELARFLVGSGDFITHILGHVRQKFAGIKLNLEKLKKRAEDVEDEMSVTEDRILRIPELQSGIQIIQARLREEILRSEPNQHTQFKLGLEPNRLTKSGTTSKSWLSWEKKKLAGPKISKKWLNWRNQVAKIQAGEIRKYNFNIQSGDQLRELLFVHAGYQTDLFTESGEIATSAKSLRNCGEVGELLIRHSELRKELGYLQAYAKLGETGRIYPNFRMPGTTTGRLSSTGPNFQQVPKTQAVMEIFEADPGHVWVDLDFAALESVVAGELSGDENLMYLYDGKSGVNNDVHLFVGAHIPGPLGARIRASGYDPRNTTDEIIRRAKKECKHERSICKTVVYACQFGAGVDRVWHALEEDGIFLSRDQVAEVHETYWDVFARLRAYSRELIRERARSGGVVYNGLGRPMSVPDEFEKDSLSRVVQSTGHDILVKYVCILTRELTRAGINWSPVILDLHDATTVQVPEADADKTCSIFRSSLDLLNRELGGRIKLRGIPVVGRNLAEVKEPEE